jgi:hypothetical protein
VPAGAAAAVVALHRVHWPRPRSTRCRRRSDRQTDRQNCTAFARAVLLQVASPADKENRPGVHSPLPSRRGEGLGGLPLLPISPARAAALGVEIGTGLASDDEGDPAEMPETRLAVVRFLEDGKALGPHLLAECSSSVLVYATDDAARAANATRLCAFVFPPARLSNSQRLRLAFSIGSGALIASVRQAGGGQGGARRL